MIRFIRLVVIFFFIGFTANLSASKSTSQNVLELTARSHFIIEDLKLTDDEWSWLRKHKTLRVAIWLPISPPYEITSGLSDYGGINADYLGIIAQNLDIKIELVKFDSKEEANKAVLNGDVDLVVLNSDKKSPLLITEPYSETMPVLVFNSNNDINKISPKKIAVDSSLLSMDFYKKYIASEYPEAEIIESEYIRYTLETLSFGKIDLFLGDKSSAIYFIRQSNLNNLLVKPLNSDDELGFFFAVSPEKEVLVDIINKVLRRIPSSIQVNIHRRWNGGVPLLISDFKPKFSSLELSWMEKKKVLRVALPTDNLPINYFDEHSNPHGMVIDILSALKEQTKMDFLLQPYPTLDSAIQSVITGESDIIAGTSQETIWDSNLLTTSSWLYSSWVIVVNKNNYHPYKSLIVVKKQYPKKYLEENTINQYIIYSDSWSEALDKLNKGQGNAVLMPLVMASAYIENEKYSNLEIITSLDTEPIRFAFGVSQELYPLINIINKGLYSINPEDIYAITNNQNNNYSYIDTSKGSKLSIDSIISIIIFVIVLLFILGFLTYRVKKHLKALKTDIADLTEKIIRKDAFIVMLSHEIRTPISTIKGILELIDEKKGVNQENNTLFLNSINASNALLSLVNNVLDISGVENDRLLLKPEKLLLINFIELISVNFEPTIAKKNLSYQIELDSKLNQYVLADPTRIQQVLTNVLGNAIKFTHHGGITLKGICPWENEHQICVHLIVEDTGLGIDEETQKTLFHPFSQGDTPQQKLGNGLGLYLSLILAQMMGGNITLSSQLNIGTQMTIELVLTKMKDNIEEKLAPLVSSEKTVNLAILIVDDNPSNLLLLKHQLSHLGHNVISFNNAHDAINYLNKNPIDAVITDCYMPNINGFHLAEVIRKTHPNIAIFGMTADPSQQVHDACMKSGMNDCLLKPIELSQLTTLLSNITPISTQNKQWLNYQCFSPENVKSEFSLGSLKIQFCNLQIGVIDDTLKILTSEADFQSPTVHSALHRLVGGIQLLGENSVETLLARQKNHPDDDIAKRLILILEQFKLELLQWRDE